MSAGSGGGSCLPLTVYGVAATVTDASTGNTICDATVTLTDTSDPTHVETAMVRGSGMDCTYVGAPERPGTYKVEASKSGYKSASTEVTVMLSGTMCKHVRGTNPMLALAPN